MVEVKTRVARIIAEAMRTVHQQGIWQRDLKPANILPRTVKEGVFSSQDVKVIDFGLALRTQTVKQNMMATNFDASMLGMSAAVYVNDFETPIGKKLV